MTSSVAARILACVTLVVAACTGEGGDAEVGARTQTSTGEWPSMDQSVACGALSIYAYNAEESHAVAVVLSGVTSEQLMDGYTIEAELPDPSVEVQLLRGVQVDDPFCNDLVGGDHAIEDTWTPVTGSVSVTVNRNRVAVEDLNLDLPDGATVNVALFQTQVGPAGG